MSEGLTDSVKQVLEERIKNPLWGFIILAWFWFNWPNLAMLFMSDAPVKFRIDYILSQEYFYLHFVLVPVLAGVLLAVVSPYAQWMLSKAHKWADDKSRDNVHQSKKADLQDAIKLSKLQVQSDRAVETENAKIDADILVEVERGKREELKTEELEAKKKAIIEEIEGLRLSVDLQKEEVSYAVKEKEKVQDLIVESLQILELFMNLDKGVSSEKLKAMVEGLYSSSEIEMSSIRNALKGRRELSAKETLTFFNKMNGKINLEKLKSKDGQSETN